MRYSSFRGHMVEVKQSNLFKQWTTGSCDAAGNPSTPIELLVLGVLRYLGRAVTFDDLEEHTGISEETHRRFFHIVEFGSTSSFQKYVQLPSDNDIESFKLKLNLFFITFDYFFFFFFFLHLRLNKL